LQARCNRARVRVSRRIGDQDVAVDATRVYVAHSTGLLIYGPP